ncbi:uncharacterized protein K460DRAFT_394989 [Cucurbitaria berberidis CBS 394.84]|uniref:Stress-response A/B barrel domain-containing protein n=1 Tax=Cucurbitaria berberidis CBS 394.84 TaxID=1168544 RepID=A0A9P4GHF5_9PLEO|nr:uncharacterized protein K460DRAFT_394989 [Cucurbitaria berberidis CBS 394.84]KAF1845304.1 hypothetical protein K460DRAFT_394989 [Cucurbitaria berberidis CBS 394.84]
MPQIVRLTLFKIPDPAIIQEAIQKYSTLSQDAVKDGKQYIQLALANPAHADPRSQGYTMVARTVFESKNDMDYYDNECQAHTAIKAYVKPNVAGPPLVLYTDA